MTNFEVHPIEICSAVLKPSTTVDMKHNGLFINDMPAELLSWPACLFVHI